MAKTEPGSKTAAGGAGAIAVAIAVMAVYRAISNQPAPEPAPAPGPGQEPVFVSQDPPAEVAPALDDPVPECVPDEYGDTALTSAAKRRNCAYKQLVDCVTQTPTECASLQQAYDEADRAYKELVGAEFPQQHSDAQPARGVDGRYRGDDHVIGDDFPG